MRTANSLWPNKNLFINTNYIKVIEDYYNGKNKTILNNYRRSH